MMSSTLKPCGGAEGGGDSWRRSRRRSVALGTDLTMTDVEHLQTEIRELRKEVSRLEMELNRWRGGDSSREDLRNISSPSPLLKTEPKMAPLQIQLDGDLPELPKLEDQSSLSTEPNHVLLHRPPKLEDSPGYGEDPAAPADQLQQVQTPVRLVDCRTRLELDGEIKQEKVEVEVEELCFNMDTEDDSDGFGPSVPDELRFQVSSEVLSRSFEFGEDPDLGGRRNPSSLDGEPSFSCSSCRRSFALRSDLLTHLKVHPGEKPHCCPHCGKAFKKLFNLKSHQRVHTGEKPYLCTSCGKQFSRESYLKIHQRVHTGEKPYSCSECGKQFRWVQALAIHQNIHSGEKPHSCSTCGKRFSQGLYLRRHQRVHTGERAPRGPVLLGPFYPKR